jgi:hypothetical protein
MLDLDQARRERAEARKSAAAAQEGRGDTLVIQFGGEQIAVLEPELPLDVLEPLRTVSEDIGLLIRFTLSVAEKGGAEDAQREAMKLFLDLFGSNPNLGGDLVDVVSGIGRRLLTDEGFERFMAQRPSREDIVFLASGVIKWYGVSPGESSRSTESVMTTIGGPTSRETSPSTTEAETAMPGTSTHPLGLTDS